MVPPNGGPGHSDTPWLQSLPLHTQGGEPGTRDSEAHFRHCRGYIPSLRPP